MAFHPMIIYKLISFAFLKSWNEYHPLLHHGRLDRIYLAHNDNFVWMRNCSVGHLYAKNRYPPKGNLFGLQKKKIHSVHGNPSDTVAGSETCPLCFQAVPGSTLLAYGRHIILWIFTLFHLFKKSKL